MKEAAVWESGVSSLGGLSPDAVPSSVSEFSGVPSRASNFGVVLLSLREDNSRLSAEGKAIPFDTSIFSNSSSLFSR